MHRNRRRIAKLLVLLFLPVLAAVADDLLPSETTTLMRQAMRHQPDAARKTLTGPLIARMKSGDYHGAELFLKGEVHFLHLEPEPSRDAFWAFRNRDDNLGRVANQRLMVIRINAFNMVDEVLETDIPRYRQRFPVRSDDRHGISFVVGRIARSLADRGEVQRGLDLVVDEVRRHDRFDAPYTAYTLPGQFLDLASANGRGDEFLELVNWVRTGIDDAIERRLDTEVASENKSFELPGDVFFSLFEDQRLDYHQWTAEFLKMRDRLAPPDATD